MKNRQIKFRAFSKRENKMYNFGKNADTLVIDNSSGDEDLWQFGKGHYDWVVEGPSFGNGDILMQFTGLLDKNGVELYEGDVVKFADSSKNYLIEYADGRFYGLWQSKWNPKVNEMITTISGKTDWFEWETVGDESTDPSQGQVIRRVSAFEILGNKYENPELLVDGQV